MCITRLGKITTAALALSVFLWAAASPFVGSWKLNPEKSQFGSRQPIQQATYRMQAEGNGLKITYDGPNAQGQHVTSIYTSNLDGTPVKVSGGIATFVIDRVDDHTLTVKAV